MAPYAAQDFFYLSPIKIFEYMAVGRAVLAARVGQIGEVIEDGVTGLLYDPSDPASLSAALHRLVEDVALRRRLGESARRTVEERYTWQANARSVAGLLEDVLERRRASRTLVGAPGRMGRALRSLRCDLSRVRLEAPAGARLWAVVKRTLKIVVALLAHASGLTGPLLRRLLRSRQAAVILCYHGLVSEMRGLLDSGYAVEEVAGLLRYLSRHLTPLPLEALADPVAAGGPPPPATFAVTFDDGLLNNVTLALPVLRSLGVPATFFVPSGLVGSTEDLWDSRLREVISALPDDSIPAEPGLWPALPLGREASRYKTLFRIKQILKAHEGRRPEVLQRLAGRAGGPRPHVEDRVVGPDRLGDLAGGGQAVGSHSRNHRILAALDSGQAREEIAGSRQDLERILGTQVTVFAFPNGRFHDFDENTLRLVAEAGYRIALTTEPGVVQAGDDPLALRRCVPENVPAFLTAFDLLLRVWKDRDRPPDAARPLRRRITHLGDSRNGAAA
jgi:peptidoglycan/xylan/chitin deacetylase (PgdA/CDA1 family)